MLHKRLLGTVAATALAAILAGCNLGKSPAPTVDANALYTAAAATLISQLNDQQTQTAQVASPTALATFTPLPTFPLGPGLTPFGTAFTLGTGTPGLGITPLATLAGSVTNCYPVGADNACFNGETIKDGTKMSPLHSFKKCWDFLNGGTTTWDENYMFAFKSGERMDGVDIKIVLEKDFTKPGHTQNFCVPMNAPKSTGEHKGLWQMRNDAGVWFGSLVSVDIIVQ
jgi:hypothetical protein